MRRNSDRAFRDMIRRINAGEYDLIPALARLWERQRGPGGRITPDVLEDVIEAFDQLEADPRIDEVLDLMGTQDHQGFGEDASYAVGVLHGVKAALDLSDKELLAESERARDGASARRLALRRSQDNPTRRNSDRAFRDMIRRINAGEDDLIPALARLWERRGERGSMIAPAVLAEVVATFERLERSPQRIGVARIDVSPRGLLVLTDMPGGGLLDAPASVRDVGFLVGVMTALGLSGDELWAESERARGGAGTRRLERAGIDGTPNTLRRYELEVWTERAITLAHRAGLTRREAVEAVDYMIDSPEEAEEATDPRTLALAALRWHEGVWRGNMWDASNTPDARYTLAQARAVHDRAVVALAALEGMSPS